MLSRSIVARRGLSPRQTIPYNPLISAYSSLRSRRCLVTGSQDPRPRISKARAVVGSERNLATPAWSEYRPSGVSDGMHSMMSMPYSGRQPLPYELRPFDPNNPLIVMDNSPLVATQRVNVSGIPGDTDEMLALFDALVEVGKLDRAELILSRFGRISSLDGLNMMSLHNKYLQARLAQLQNQPGLHTSFDMHTWFRAEIRAKYLPYTGQTISYMLKMCLLTHHGDELERYISLYLNAHPNPELGLDKFVLDDHDLATIANHSREFMAVPDPTVPAEEEAPVAQVESAKQSAATPEILQTPQKGSGLKTLKQALSLFDQVSEGEDISKLSYDARREFQSKLEKDCVDAAMARWREENEVRVQIGHHPILSSLSHSTLGLKVSQWQMDLAKRIKKEIELIEAAESGMTKNPEDSDRCRFGPFIRLGDPDRLAVITILGMLNAFATNGLDRGVSVNRLVNIVAKFAEHDVKDQMLAKEKAQKAKAQKAKAKLRLKRVAESSAPAPSPKQQAAPTTPTASAVDTVHSTKKVLAIPKIETWPIAIRAKIGAFLVSSLTEIAKIDNTKQLPETKERVTLRQPAFHHSYHLKGGKKVGILRANRALVEIMKREPRPDFLARHLPMLVEPEPWTGFLKGGFLEYPTTLVRIRPGDRDQKLYTDAAIERGHLDQVLKGLDVLGKTAWRINRPVFDVILEAWNSKEGLANIPPLNPPIGIPTQPEMSSDPLDKSRWSQRVQAAMNEMAGLHSQRCFMNFQLEIARAYRDQTIYFPHNVDFRGRAYPVPPYLNHMGADHTRALLRFAKGKELGTAGLRWLKVHLANVYGYDKASLAEREEFAMRNLENIRDSATNPLKGKRWWLEAEDPWQCLATCFELQAALDSPDPSKFVSHMPVHQDGTCNGLQHYAALGGDSWGAQQVNLMPGEAPADVYSAVANLVDEHIAKDVEAGNPFGKAVQGKIARKVVKQTVMTNVYGVTYVGAKKQVLRQLVSLYPTLESETGISHRLLAAYVTTKIFLSMSTMFRGAHDIQAWLGEVGARVCRAISPEQVQEVKAASEEGKEVVLGTGAKKTAKKTRTKAKATGEKRGPKAEDLKVSLDQFRSTIVWTTPLRMPVVQPYRSSKTKMIHTCMQDIQLAIPGRFDPVDKRKQLQAFPPNFIHSLDASHMLLTALECDERGLSFAAVHDSFWTHAADVDTMSDAIRDAFIRIHSEDVVTRLASEFEARYKDYIRMVKIDYTSETAKMIKEHRRENPLTSTQEMVEEMTRLQLLGSSDPAEVEKGMNMVTPGSIFDAMAAEEIVEPEDEVTEGLGSIPKATKKSAKASLDAEEASEKATSSEAEDFVNPGLVDPTDEASANTVPQHSFSKPAVAGLPHFSEHNEKLKDELEKDYFAAATEPRKSNSWKNVINVWVPFRLPPIPKKGDFDVNKLRDSKYFFS